MADRQTRRNRQLIPESLLNKSWLLIPLFVIGLVLALGLTHRRQEQKVSTDNFKVTTPGSPLAPQPKSKTLPENHIPELKREHVPEGTRVKYNSNPPTSGPHYAVEAQWAIYNKPPVDEQLVHNLEHGGVIISYNPDRIKGEELEQIKAQARKLSAINPRIIVTPRPKMDTAIALTAWGYLQKLDSYDPEAVKAFYDAHIARGPECEKGLCPG
jgi:hypothetical protein